MKTRMMPAGPEAYDEAARLLRDGMIDKEQAQLYAIHPETLERQSRFMGR